MATLIQMLQYTLAQKEATLPNDVKRVVLKEALQAYVLDFLYNHPVYRNLNFYGGTCTHVIYGLNRLSEDLDLDNSSKIPLDGLVKELKAFFSAAFGYADMTIKTQLAENGIFRLTLRLPVLYALELSSHADEALHLKIEISQHEQIAVIRKTPVFFYGRSFVPAHFSLETLMAGKMLACLERNFMRGREGAAIKGRDFYDLLWFMQKNVQPLEEKLAREGKKPYTTAQAIGELAEKVKGIRVEDLAADLRPLFEQRAFIDAWLQSFHENFEEWVKRYE